MVIEDSIQPYKNEKSRKNNEMKFYTLPFPQKELENLGSTNVEMRVTLSYFIEPKSFFPGTFRSFIQISWFALFHKESC
jgi:hypothetical protein